MGEADLHSTLLHQQIDNKTQYSGPHEYNELGIETFYWQGRSNAYHCSRRLGGKRTLFFTTGTACLWHMAFFGVFFNLVLFFKNVLDEGSGVAAGDTNNWMGASSLSSLLGAFMAESFVGRLWTYVAFQTLQLVGLLLLLVATNMVLSAEIPTAATRALLHSSLYLVSVSYGASAPVLQSVGADQFDEEGDKTLFFTYHVVCSNVGMALADTAVVYVVSAKGWLVGFGLVTIVGAGGWLLFACGIPLYRQYRNRGNPYKRALQVVVAAARKWRVPLPTDSDDLYQEEGVLNNNLNEDQGKPVPRLIKHTDSFRWLDKAATFVSSDLHEEGDHASSCRCQPTRNEWKLRSVAEVEEVKDVVRLVPIWATLVFYHTLHSQTATLLVEEGALMDTSIRWAGGLTLEPASMNLFNILVVVVVGPLYKVAMVPVARRITGLREGLSPLQQTGIGYVAAIAALSIGGILEAYRLHCYNKGMSAPSILWQVPVFSLLGFANFMGSVGQLGFFYLNIPPSLRSVGGCLLMTGTALGNYVSSLLVWGVTLLSGAEGAGWLPADLNTGRLHYFLWLLGGLGSLNFLCFLACGARHHRHSAH